MEKAAKRLNLKSHIVGFNSNNQVMLHAAGDLEGHLGTDGRFYLIDFGRAFPPEGPSPEYEVLRLNLSIVQKSAQRGKSIIKC
jgi:hypothetical protein